MSEISIVTENLIDVHDRQSNSHVLVDPRHIGNIQSWFVGEEEGTKIVFKIGTDIGLFTNYDLQYDPVGSGQQVGVPYVICKLRPVVVRYLIHKALGRSKDELSNEFGMDLLSDVG